MNFPPHKERMIRLTAQKKQPINAVQLIFDARSVNEAYARTVVSALVSQLDPSVAELTDIRTAVSEGVTNAVIHAYRGRPEGEGKIRMQIVLYDDRSVRIRIRDDGCGIADIAQARRPLFTTDPSGERGGMGFAIMESFTDGLQIQSRMGKGTTVTMVKKIRG